MVPLKMFVSKRAFVVVVSLGLAVGCGSAAEEGTGSPVSGDPSSSPSENAATSSTSEGASTGAGGAGGEGTGSSSGGSSSGGITPANVPSALTCTQCSAFAADQANAGAMDAWQLCNGGTGIPESYALYAAYLGCLCSGPCVNECETSLCALAPTDATPTCKSCLALNNAACSSSKSACLADK